MTTPGAVASTTHRMVGSIDVLLADGTIAVIREIRSGDRPDLQYLHEGLSPENLRFRFFSLSRTAAHAYVDHVLAAAARNGALALGLWRRGTLLGVATAEPVGDDTAEVSCLVDDRHHGLGIGTLLLEHLAVGAHDHGLTRFTADVLSDNAAMLTVLRDAGFVSSESTDRGIVTVELQTAVTAEALRAADRRDACAEAASLAPLLSPARVAVVGVRRDGTGVGAAILESIITGGYRGDVVVVHPSGAAPGNVLAYRSFEEVPVDVDLVVVAVPPASAARCVADAARAGARAAVVVTSGFAELGAEGARLQRELARTAREHGIRVVGPNCLGLLDNQPAARLDATFGIGAPPPGGLAVASQSGGVGIVVLDLARRRGLGIRHFVSLGNKADVSSNELLEAWLDDPDVDAAALYLESFGSAAKFARIARRFCERKPLLAVFGGRSGGGRRAGASHTAAASTPAGRVDALVAQTGVIPCADAEDLVAAASLLECQPLPTGTRLGVVTNAGGMGVLAADAADAEGLDVPALSADIQGRLAAAASGTIGAANPVDAGAAASAAALGSIIGDLLDSSEVDAVLLIIVRTRLLVWEDVEQSVLEARQRHPDKTMLAVLLGGIDPPSLPGIALLPSVGMAVRALGHVARYAAWRRGPRTEPAAADEVRATRAHGWAAAHVEQHGSGWLGPEEAHLLLAPYGLGQVGVVVGTPMEAVDAASRTGLPVVLKVADPAVVHKTERGLVRSGLASTDEVSRAAADLARARGPGAQLLVQPLVRGVELAMGITRDPGLGPLVMVAAGGTATELLMDRSLLLAPVSAEAAADALESLRIWPLLTGYRGTAPVDVEAVVASIVALGRLADDVPEIIEMDVNPLIAHERGVDAVDVKVRLGAAEPPDTGIPRHLRPVG